MTEDLQAIREIHGKIKDAISLEDFRSRIDSKVKEHFGLLSEVGAAKLLAREMGASFEAPQLAFKVKNLVPGMQNVDVAGRVVNIYGVRSFNRDTGSGKVSNMLIMDETGSVRVVLWGEKAEPIEKDAIKRGDIVEIRSGYARTGLSGEVELHVGRRGRLLVNPAISDAIPEIVENKVKVKDVKDGMRDLSLEAVVSAVSNVRTFSRADGTSGKVGTLFLRDETGEIRLSVWNEKTLVLEGIQKGDRLRVAGAYSRAGLNGVPEIHCSASSSLTVCGESGRELPGIERMTSSVAGLVEGMQSVDLSGRIERILGKRSFTRLNGQEGKVANLIISDGTGQARLVLWGDAADLASSLAEGSRVRVENAYTKLGLNQEMEIHVGWRGRVVAEVEEFKPVVCDLVPGMDNLDLELGVVEVGLPEEFDDAKLVSAVVGDASGRATAVFWDGHVDPVQGLEPGIGLRVRNAKVNDLGEIQVLPESSLEVLERRVAVLGDDEPKNLTIAEAQQGLLVRIRAAPMAATVLRHTSSFGREGLVCFCVIDDGSGQMTMEAFGPRCGVLFDEPEGKTVDELRTRLRKGADVVLVGVVLDGCLRVREIRTPDARSEIASMIDEISEVS